MFDFDVIVIGAGPAGTECARILGRNNKKVAIVEANALGGTCLNKGCIPAKTMLYSAEMYRHAKALGDYGITIFEDKLEYDFDKMVQKRADIMDKLRKGVNYLLTTDKVEIINGHAKFIADNTIEVDGKSYSAEKFVIASGGSARKFPNFKENDDRYLISDNIFELKGIPKSMLIVGGGPVGVEFATYFATFGTKVTIVDLADHILSFFDADLGNELAKLYNRRGIEVITGTTVSFIDDSSDLLNITLSDGRVISAEYVMSAIGVVPYTDYLNALNLELERGRVKVNNDLQTSKSHIYAIGDTIGLSGSAYGAEREGLFVAHHILEEYADYYKIDYTSFPDPVFTYPEVGTCGLSEEECKAKNIDYLTVKVPYLVNAKAQIKSETQGFIKLIADCYGTLLGAHIIGDQATEIMHMLTIPIMQKMKVSDLRRMVYAHPVVSEIVKEALTKLHVLILETH